jgi:hypothetical protein
VNHETAEVLAWLSRFISTLEDGAIDSDEAAEVLSALAGVADHLKGRLGRRWWRLVCSGVAHCLREGADEIRRQEAEAKNAHR